MTRTTKPDEYSDVIKELRQKRAERKISAFALAAYLSFVWDRRHGRI